MSTPLELEHLRQDAQKKIPFHSLAISNGANLESMVHSFSQSRSPTINSGAASPSTVALSPLVMLPALKNLDRDATALSRTGFSPAGTIEC